MLKSLLTKRNSPATGGLAENAIMRLIPPWFASMMRFRYFEVRCFASDRAACLRVLAGGSLSVKKVCGPLSKFEQYRLPTDGHP
jgi:hypothetical protein